jgi:hypothetical protein
MHPPTLVPMEALQSRAVCPLLWSADELAGSIRAIPRARARRCLSKNVSLLPPGIHIV